MSFQSTLPSYCCLPSYPLRQKEAAPSPQLIREEQVVTDADDVTDGFLSACIYDPFRPNSRDEKTILHEICQFSFSKPLYFQIVLRATIAFFKEFHGITGDHLRELFNLRDSDGMTCHAYAMQSVQRAPKFVQVLYKEQLGAGFRLPDGRCLLHVYLQTLSEADINEWRNSRVQKVVEYLQDDLNVVAADDSTPLRLTCSYKCPYEIMEYCCNLGGDINYVDDSGNTLLTECLRKFATMQELETYNHDLKKQICTDLEEKIVFFLKKMAAEVVETVVLGTRRNALFYAFEHGTKNSASCLASFKDGVLVNCEELKHAVVTGRIHEIPKRTLLRELGVNEIEVPASEAETPIDDERDTDVRLLFK